MMAIEIINPKRVAVTLRCTRKGTAYQVDIALRSFLERRDWALQKVGRENATMVPPHGTKAPFVFNVDIPTRDQILALAKEQHAVQKLWVGQLGEWVAYYLPPRSLTWTDMDPFTGQAISDPKPGGSSCASFHVGTRSFWYAMVWGDLYYESASQPIPLQTAEFVFPEENQPTVELVEGAVCRISVNAYERNPEARRQCIEAHGADCCICGFSFGDLYGAEAEGYIQVHHIRPLAEVHGDHVVDPVKDLRPVCPNCHAVLHLGQRCRTIEEVSRLLVQNKTRKL
jgi:hypothetical protein